MAFLAIRKFKACICLLGNTIKKYFLFKFYPSFGMIHLCLLKLSWIKSGQSIFILLHVLVSEWNWIIVFLWNSIITFFFLTHMQYVEHVICSLKFDDQRLAKYVCYIFYLFHFTTYLFILFFLWLCNGNMWCDDFLFAENYYKISREIHCVWCWCVWFVYI